MKGSWPRALTQQYFFGSLMNAYTLPSIVKRSEILIRRLVLPTRSTSLADFVGEFIEIGEIGRWRHGDSRARKYDEFTVVLGFDYFRRKLNGSINHERERSFVSEASRARR